MIKHGQNRFFFQRMNMIEIPAILAWTTGAQRQVGRKPQGDPWQYNKNRRHKGDFRDYPILDYPSYNWVITCYNML